MEVEKYKVLNKATNKATNYPFDNFLNHTNNGI